MTGPLSHVALFLAGNNPRYYALGVAGPSIWSNSPGLWYVSSARCNVLVASAALRASAGEGPTLMYACTAVPSPRAAQAS